MTDDRQAQASQARQWVRRALAGTGHSLGSPVVTRPAWRGSDRTVETVAPAAAIEILRDIELCARGAAREEIGWARAAGLSWQKVGEALGITGKGDGIEHSIAELAFQYAAPHDSKWAQDYGPSLTWGCPSCGGRVTDRGPDWGLGDAESGHVGGCRRRAGCLGSAVQR